MADADRSPAAQLADAFRASVVKALGADLKGARMSAEDVCSTLFITAAILREWTRSGSFPPPSSWEGGKPVWTAHDLANWLKGLPPYAPYAPKARVTAPAPGAKPEARPATSKRPAPPPPR